MQNIVLFDFDGVIVDSFEITYQSAKEVGSPITREQHKKLLEGNFFETLKKIKEISADHHEQFYEKYLPRLFELSPVNGIAEVLSSLGNSYRLVVVSSTISSPIRGYLETHHLDRHFDWIMGSDVHQSKTEKIKMAMRDYRVNPEQCVFITDTLGDIREAAKCSVRAIGVSWGFHEQERLERGRPFMVVNKVEELPGAVEAFFTAEEKSNYNI